MSGYEDPQKPFQPAGNGYEQVPVGYQTAPVGGSYYAPAPDPQQTYQGVPYQGGYQSAGYTQPPPEPLGAPGPGAYGATGYGAAAQGGASYQAYQPTVMVGVPLYPDSQDATLKSKFISQGYKDVWAAVVFLVQLVVTIVWGFINVGKYSEDFKGDSDSLDGSFHSKLAKYLPAAAFTSLGVVLVMLILIRQIPRAFIVTANVAVITIDVVVAVVGFAKHITWFAVVFTILAVLHAVWLYCVRRRIPLAGSLLANSTSVLMKHYGSIVVSFVSLIAVMLHLIFFSLMVVPTMQNIDNKNFGSSHSGTRITFGEFILVCLFLLMFYWTTQVIVNVVHVTASGTVATWYFAGPSQMPKNPSVASLKRALTTSFGSICFGSLIVAFLKLLHALARNAARHRNNFLSLIAVCFIGCIEKLMELFNVYAFTHVAIYGSSFTEAARQTWELIRNCALSAIINDNLVYPVLNLVIFVDSLAIGGGYGYASDSSTVGLICFLISAVIHLLVLRVVYSGIVTLFVCYAENPQILAASNPEFNQELQEGVESLKQSIC